MSALAKIQAVSEQRNAKINKVEKTKALYTPDEALDRLKKFAAEGYDAIPKEDKAVFFKYFGIFDKEKPNGKNHFMLRVRIPGGQMTPEQAKKVGEVAKTYGNNYIDITTRMQIELRYLKIEDLPTVLEALESVGITTYQTGIDNLRNIVTDPLDGLSFDQVLETYPTLMKMQEVFLKKEAWIGTLPRKFNTSITGSYANRCNVFAHDCCFVLAQKDGIYGYNVYLGGRVGMLAKKADVFLQNEAEVLAFFETLITIFKAYGFRDNRNKNRLHFFIEAVGMETLVQAIREESSIDFLSGGETLVQLDHHEAVHGRIQQKDGTFALHVIVPAGIFDGDAMKQAGEIAEIYGSGVRLSVDQNLYITGIKQEDIAKVLDWELFDSYKNINTPFFNHLISCAGSETCSFGVIKGKSDALSVSAYLSEQLEIPDGKVRIYWSACVKGCGIHELGDIGLLGCKARIGGKPVEGVDILLGGKMLNESAEAKTLLKAIPMTLAGQFLEMLIEQYQKLKNPNETFEHFYDRVLTKYSFPALAFLISYNYQVDKVHGKPEYKLHLSKTPKTKAHEAFEIFDFGEKLYRTVHGTSPYKLVSDFAPDASQKSVFIGNALPGNLPRIVDKMLVNDKTRAKVFSELLVELNIF